MSKGLLYCQGRNTDCINMYRGNGICKLQSCILDDPQYQAAENAKIKRQNELLEKERCRKQEERSVARQIRKQIKPLDSRIQEEIFRTKEKMNRYYTRGWTKAADNLSRELAALQRKQEGLRK